MANGYFSYVFDHGMMKNLTLGTGITVSTGTPINDLAHTRLPQRWRNSDRRPWRARSHPDDREH